VGFPPRKKFVSAGQTEIPHSLATSAREFAPVTVVSFLPVVAFLSCVCLCVPRPLPTAEGLDAMPWWAPLGGLVGAFAVIAGLLFVGRVGAGVLAGLTITANILMSLAIDKYGWFGMGIHPLSGGRIAGAGLMVAGIALISKF
jgi:transporter family-2 protein